MAYKFLESSGLQNTAEKTGHTSQKLFGSGDSLFSGIGLIINSLLGLVGVVFMILMMYGGYLWMTAQGNESQVEKAIGIMKAAIIGLAITFSAFAISYFVMSNFGGQALT
jgi:hypothetical protein